MSAAELDASDLQAVLDVAAQRPAGPGPQGRRLRTGPGRLRGGGARGGGGLGHRGPAPDRQGPGHRPRGRGAGALLHLRRQRQRHPVRRGRRRCSRKWSRTPATWTWRTWSGGSPPGAGRHGRGRLRPPRGLGRPGAGRRPPRPGAHRRLLRSHRRRLPGPQAGFLRRRGGLRLLPQQADDHRRGGHGGDQRRRAGGALPELRQPGAGPRWAPGSGTTGWATTTAWTSCPPPWACPSWPGWSRSWPGGTGWRAGTANAWPASGVRPPRSARRCA